MQAIYNVLALSIESKQDIVLSPLPAYGLYKHQTELLGGTFVPIPTRFENDFIPDVDVLRSLFEHHVDSKNQLLVRSIVLGFPDNPAGSCLSEAKCKEIANFLDEMLIKYENPGKQYLLIFYLRIPVGFSIILDEVYFGILGKSSYKSYQSILMHSSPRVLQSTFLVLSGSKGILDSVLYAHSHRPGCNAWSTCWICLFSQHALRQTDGQGAASMFREL